MNTQSTVWKIWFPTPHPPSKKKWHSKKYEVILEQIGDGAHNHLFKHMYTLLGSCSIHAMYILTWATSTSSFSWWLQISTSVRLPPVSTTERVSRARRRPSPARAARDSKEQTAVKVSLATRTLKSCSDGFRCFLLLSDAVFLPLCCYLIDVMVFLGTF